MRNIILLFRKTLFLGIFVLLWTGLTLDGLRAETIVISDTIPTRTTNWSDALTIPAFDAAWGQLTSISMTLETPIAGSVSYENTSNETVVITSTHAVSVNLQLLDGTLLKSLPNVIRVDTVPPYDGESDFQGESGDSFTMNTTLVVQKHYTSTAVLDLFYGNTPLQLPITATGASYISGPGNFDAVLRAQAAGVVFTIYFDYLPIDIAIKKFTNGRDADEPNGNDLPVVFPGAPITWTYLVTNTGQMTLTGADIVVTDSDPTVVPYFDPTSDNGDGLLSPGEVWRYLATGKALDIEAAPPSNLIVDGCQKSNGTTLRAYENVATVVARDHRASDPSHYCNPTTRKLLPGIVIEKLINGFDADGPDDPDVPLFFPGTAITWTYLVTNTGDISFTLSQVVVSDDDPTLIIKFDSASDNGDNLLAPGEQWRFSATGIARNLLVNTLDIVTVDGCDPGNSGNKKVAYRNIGTVTINELIASDPGHYCNFPPTVLDEQGKSSADAHAIYLPMIAN